MTVVDEQPWFHAALQLLDLRSHDRVLAIGCAPAQVRAVAASVGRRGEVMVACDDGAVADAIATAAPQQVEVLAHTTTGTERYGTFDAMFVTAPWGPLLPGESCASLAMKNLRPGGRCVFDLPGIDMVPELASVLGDAGWPPERLAPLHGIGDDVLAEALRGAGLRSVRGVLGSHLMQAASAGELVERFAPALALSVPECLEIARMLARRAGTTAAFDVLVHRTRVQALR